LNSRYSCDTRQTWSFRKYWYSLSVTIICHVSK
jgi:hypothetical protein